MGDNGFSSLKVQRATKFLLLPEISRLDGNHTKASFLMSKGLNQSEVTEAFIHYYKNRKFPSQAQLLLNNVSKTEENIESGPLQTLNEHRSSGISLFFQVCRKIVILASITSTVYYFYRNWFGETIRKAQSKKDKKIEDELAFIKTELQKIHNELRQYEGAERSNLNLASELKSLKAILVSRQYFEEKQSEKLILPSWQLKVSAAKNDEALKNESSTKSVQVNGDASQNESSSAKPVQGNGDASTSTLVSDTKNSCAVEQNGTENLPKTEPVEIKNEIENKIEGKVQVGKSNNNDNVINGISKGKKSSSKAKNNKSQQNENSKVVSVNGSN